MLLRGAAASVEVAGALGMGGAGALGMGGAVVSAGAAPTSAPSVEADAFPAALGADAGDSIVAVHVFGVTVVQLYSVQVSATGRGDCVHLSSKWLCGQNTNHSRVFFL